MKKTFKQKLFSLLLSLLMVLSFVSLLSSEKAVAINPASQSPVLASLYGFDVKSPELIEQSKKTSVQNLIKKLTDYNWYYFYDVGDEWPFYYHMDNGRLKQYSFGGGEWETNYYSYEKESYAEITVFRENGYFRITDIGLDKVLILTDSTSFTGSDILFRCDKKFSLDSWGFPIINPSEHKYKEYENYIFSSPYLTQLGVNSIQLIGEKVVFTPKPPAFNKFRSDYPSNLSSYIADYKATAARDCCIIRMNNTSDYPYTDNVIFLIKQGSDYYSIINTANKNYEKRFVVEKLTKWFVDIPLSSWYYNCVKYNFTNGYMQGYSASKFGPTDTLKRQDFVVILSKIAGADLDKYAKMTPKLKDVKKGAYYAAAVNWAVDNNIIAGYANGNFGVNDNITREQVATILYRYMGSPETENIDTTLAKFKDVNRISSFAKTAVAWAVQNNVISGMADGRVAPTEGAARAQIASIIM
ncbi:MAG: S-layer homology domain-containing protein, partial [Clostridia bacterium]|nr:S-layer homology domain-containing protein [Clostridia bacterium]